MIRPAESDYDIRHTGRFAIMADCLRGIAQAKAHPTGKRHAGYVTTAHTAYMTLLWADREALERLISIDPEAMRIAQGHPIASR